MMQLKKSYIKPLVIIADVRPCESCMIMKTSGLFLSSEEVDGDAAISSRRGKWGNLWSEGDEQ